MRGRDSDVVKALLKYWLLEGISITSEDADARDQHVGMDVDEFPLLDEATLDGMI